MKLSEVKLVPSLVKSSKVRNMLIQKEVNSFYGKSHTISQTYYFRYNLGQKNIEANQNTVKSCQEQIELRKEQVK